MAVFAFADLHLALNIPSKRMDFFGEPWIDYTEKIKSNWLKIISEDDLVLIPGDISWAQHLEDAQIDLEWIHNLPGTKVMIRGNHDYWWSSLSKIEKILPPSIHLIQNNTYTWNEYTVGGVRLWDTDEYSFNDYIDFRDNPRAKKISEYEDPKDAKKIFERDLNRLDMSLKCFNKESSIRIAMTHYPPIGADLKESKASKILEKYKVDVCVFGHLHNVKKDSLAFGIKNGVRYVLTSCDYLDFIPQKIY